MAWNRSSETEKKRAAEAKAKTQIKLGGLAIWLALLALLGGLCYLFFFVRGNATSEVEKDRAANRKIKEVTPAPAPKAKPVEEKPAEEPKTNKFEAGIYTDERGIRRYPGGQRVWDPKGHSSPRVHVPRRIFKHMSENMIADLITTPLGTQFFGTINYGAKKFREDFANALVDKIEFTDEDTEADRQLKQTMIELKEDLRKRIKGGEDISQILTDARAEMQRVGQYREDLKKLVREAVDDESMNDDDLKDYVAAANKMLEAKGATPLSMNPVAMRNMQLKMKQFKEKTNNE